MFALTCLFRSAEHHTLYQYNLVHAEAHYIGLMQTESVSGSGTSLFLNHPHDCVRQPYYQPVPSSPTPFQINPKYHDPKPYAEFAYSWALNVKESKDVLVYGRFIILKSYRLLILDVFSLLRCRIIQLLRRKFQFSLSWQMLTTIQQNYSTACTATRNCQEQTLNIDQKSDISFYSLSTVATTYQLSIDSQGVINQKDNLDGFASTVTAWTRN